jgi:hypothetical protein
VEALEATQHAHADVSRLSDAEREQVTQELARPAAWRPLETEITYCTEAAIATAQQILRATSVVEGTFEHGGETYRFKAKPERESATTELRAASAEARAITRDRDETGDYVIIHDTPPSTDSLVRRVALVITPASQSLNREWASDAIREVAAWFRDERQSPMTAAVLEQEADQ